MIRFDKGKIGPEYRIEYAVIDSLPHLFPEKTESYWVAGSPRVGSGRPDLVIVFKKPEQSTILDDYAIQIMCYLHSVSRATAKTISNRVQLPIPTVEERLTSLHEKGIVIASEDKFWVAPILPEIITIEAKVSNWKSALQQAARNLIFSHRSFIALPDKVASRVRAQPLLKQSGIGLLAVSNDDDVRIVKRSRRSSPKVWKYYYELAFHNGKA